MVWSFEMRGEREPANPSAAFTGLGGGIYFLTHCGVLWRDEELLDTAEELAGSLSPGIANDKSFDVISGSAGLIPILLSLHGLRGSRQMLELAVECGHHLLKYGRANSQGLGWLTLSNSAE